MTTVMKKICALMMIALTAGAINGFAQQQVTYTTNQPITHIQGIDNASYQNNSQFYNKDNALATGTSTTGNGAYDVPGYSNPINSNYNTTMGSNSDRLHSVTIYGFENVYMTKPATNDNAKYGR
jgi:hypothetical protein